jgi:hypothetical protein
LPLLIVGAIVGIGTVIFLVQALGAEDAAPNRTPTPTSASPIADPANKVCRDLVDVQLLRVDALGRAVDALTEDAAALRRLGEDDRAAVVDNAIAAIESYEQVAEGGGNTQAATTELLDALDAVDWC